MLRRRKWRVALPLLVVAIAIVLALTHGQINSEGGGDNIHEVAISADGDVAIQPERMDSSSSGTGEDPIADSTAISTQHDTVSSRSHRDLFFYYLREMGITIDVAPYVPAFAYDTQWGEIWEALEDAFVGSYEFTRLWSIVLWRLSVPAVRLLTALSEALLPHFLIALQLIAEAVYDLDPIYQVFLAAATVLVAICYRQGYVRRARLKYRAFRRDLAHRYRQFVASLSEKSRLAALAVPHVLFVVVVYVVVFWSPAIVLDLWDNQSLTVVLSVGIPLVRSIRAIHQRRKEALLAMVARGAAAEEGEREGNAIQQRPRRSASSAYNEWRPYEACLKYWVLWSIVMCVSSIASLFIPSFLASYFAVPTYWLNILLTWMHSPVARGDIALYTLLSPLVNPYANRIQDFTDGGGGHGDADGENNQTNMVMRALEAVGVMRRQHLHFLKDMWSQGPALGGLMFIFTPGFVTARGALLVGFGFPAYVTMGALAEKRTRNYEWWLQYFVVAVSVDYLVGALAESVGWLPLFYHVKLLAMMWLQFPYFRGAQVIFDATHSSVFLAARPPQPQPQPPRPHQE